MCINNLIFDDCDVASFKQKQNRYFCTRFCKICVDFAQMVWIDIA